MRRSQTEAGAEGMPSAAGRPARPAPGLIRLIVLSCVLVVSAVFLGRANQTQVPAQITSIRADPTPSGLRLRVVATIAAPRFQLGKLRNPNRLVLEFAGLSWREGPSTVFSGRRAGIRRIRVEEAQPEPPLTRVTVELSVSPERLLYRAASPAPNQLEIAFSLRPRATSARTARVRARPGPTPAKPIAAAPVPQAARQRPSQPRSARAPTAAAASGFTPPVAGPTGPVRRAPPKSAALTPAAPSTQPAGAAPPPAARRQPSLLNSPLVWALSLLIVAGGAAAVMVGRRGRVRIAARRVWLREGLRSASAMQRLSALEGAKAWNAAELRAVRPELLEAAHDRSTAVSEQAKALLQTAFPAQALIASLNRGRVTSRVAAARMLALYHPTEEAAAALLAAAASSRQELRAAAVESLAAMIRERPLRAVLAAMGGADEQAKAVAAEAVRAAGPQSTDALTRGLVDPDPLVRCGAIEALAVVPSEVSLQAISSLLRDPAEQVREQAARSLGSLGDGSNVSPQLLEALKDPSFAVQQAAALALARLGGDYLEKLLVALDERASEHPETRLSEPVLDAIVAFCPGPTPALVGALSSFNRSFAEGLAQALERAGVLDTWVGRLATASGQARQQILSALRAAMLVGITGPVLRNLSKAEVAVQEACIELLGDTGEKAAVGHLVAALQLAEARLRAAAAAALGKAGGGEAVAGLVAALSDPVPSVRAAAAASLAPALKAQASGAPLPAEAEGQRTAAEEGLIAALSDPVPEMRAAAAKTLAALGAEQAVAGIVQLALRDENDMVRASAAEALEQMLAYDALPLLMDAVNSPDPDMRARAIGIFARSGSLIATDVLIEALRDANPEVRGMAGRGLWAIASQGREQVANLLSYLKSPDPKVRASIAGIIGKLGAVEHAGALAAAVADPDPRVRASIVNAFAQMKEGAAPYLPVVMDRLRDTDAFVRARAVHALCAITPESEETARRLVEAASDPDSRVQEAVSSCLAKLVERGVHGPVIELLGTPGQERIALRALSSADEALLNDVLIAARSAPPELRQTAVEALADLFRRSWTTEAFEPELRSLDVHTRLAGLEGLAVIGTTEAKQTIARLLLTDPAPEVRLRAIEILSRTAEPNAEAALRAAAEGDPDPQVRDAAAAAIASLWLSEP